MATLDRLAPPSSASLPKEGTAWRPRRAITIALAAAAVIALLQVIQSSSFANTGQQIQRLQDEKTARTAQIHDLEAEVAALSSLDRVERAARDQLGMIPATNKRYIAVQVEAPSGPLLPRPILMPAPAAQSAAAPWWQALLRALPLP